MNLSAIGIKKLAPKDKPYNLHDGGGLYLRVLPGGTKSWVFIFTMEGRKRWYGLGSWPEVSLADAREKRSEARKLVKAGKDPAEDDREKKRLEQAEPTVTEMVRDFLARHVAEKAARSLSEYQRNLEKDVIPVWGDHKVRDITRRDVHQLLEAIMDRGAKNQANQVFKIIRAMFNWAVPRYDLDFSPCSHIKLPSAEVKKDRVLSADEIRTFLKELGGAGLSESLKSALHLILVTAQRPGEVIGMHRDEIDGEWWTIPADRSKNKRAQRVYLTPQAIKIIESRPQQGFLFPSPKTGKDAAIEVNALAKAVRRNEFFGLPSWTPHDLRRTAATNIASLGYTDEIVGAVLNHTRTGVTAIYNRHGYDAEKRRALLAWDRRLDEIVTGEKSKKVVSLRGGRHE